MREIDRRAVVLGGEPVVAAEKRQGTEAGAHGGLPAAQIEGRADVTSLEGGRLGLLDPAWSTAASAAVVVEHRTRGCRRRRRTGSVDRRRPLRVPRSACWPAERRGAMSAAVAAMPLCHGSSIDSSACLPTVETFAAARSVRPSSSASWAAHRPGQPERGASAARSLSVDGLGRRVALRRRRGRPRRPSHAAQVTAGARTRGGIGARAGDSVLEPPVALRRRVRCATSTSPGCRPAAGRSVPSPRRDRPRPMRREVVELGGEAGEPPDLRPAVGPAPVDQRPLGQPGVVGGVAVPHGRTASRPSEACSRPYVGQGKEEPEASGSVGHDERLVDQPADERADLGARQMLVGAHGFGGLQAAAAGEDGEAFEHDPLVVEEQVDSSSRSRRAASDDEAAPCGHLRSGVESGRPAARPAGRR